MSYLCGLEWMSEEAQRLGGMFDLKLFFFSTTVLSLSASWNRSRQLIFIWSQVQYLFLTIRAVLISGHKDTRMSSVVKLRKEFIDSSTPLNRNLCKLEVYSAPVTARNQINDTGHLITKRRVVGATYHLSSPFWCVVDSPLI